MVEMSGQLAEEQESAARERRRKKRSKHKRKSRKQDKLVRNLVWFGGGVAVGLPLLAAMLFAMSS